MCVPARRFLHDNPQAKTRDAGVWESSTTARKGGRCEKPKDEGGGRSPGGSKEPAIKDTEPDSQGFRPTDKRGKGELAFLGVVKKPKTFNSGKSRVERAKIPYLWGGLITT